MIISIEKINVPESGKYKEVVYDIPSSWNSRKWTWLKFMNDKYDEWCVEFRGEYRGHGISERDDLIYVLTTDYLFLLSRKDGSIRKYLDKPEYNELTVSPVGDCIVASYYHISVLDTELENKIVIEPLIPLDMILFTEWKGNDLVVHADEFCNWDNHIVLKLNCITWNTEIIKQTKQGIR